MRSWFKKYSRGSQYLATDTQHLRDSLIRSLQREPLLVEAEMALHSSSEQDLASEFRQAVALSLRSAPPMAKVHREGFGGLEGDLIEQFRSAMRAAVRSGDNLAMSEKELLSTLDLEKLGEFRSQLDTHLESDPEISEEDLAIYVPSGLGITEEFRRSLALEPAEVLKPEEVDKPEIPAEPDPLEHRPIQLYAPGAYVARASDAELELEGIEGRIYAPGAYVDRALKEDSDEIVAAPAQLEAEPAPVEIPARAQFEPEPASPEIPSSAELEAVSGDHKHERVDAALIAGSLRAGIEGLQAEEPSQPGTSAPAAQGLTAVPTLTAALEAIGPAIDDYGFIVRYGRYAPKGRRSEFLVGGLGFSELSRRLTSWLETRGSLDDQVQVLDEGSGELTIYLLPAETQY